MINLVKKLLLGSIAVLIMISCTRKPQDKQIKVEEAVKTYITGSLQDNKEYRVISFSNIDSMRLEDTPVYREAERQKEDLENLIVNLRQQVRAIDEAGQRDINHLYTEAANQLVADEYRLQEMEKKLKEWENNRNEYVYTVRHRYRIEDTYNPRDYEDNFYVDKHYRVMELEAQ